MTRSASLRQGAEATQTTQPRWLKHFAQTLGTTIGIQVIGLFTGVLVARVLGVEGRGQLAAILLWVQLVPFVGDLGLPLAYAYEAARDRKQIPALIGNALLLTSVQWPILAAAGAALIAVVLRRYGADIQLVAVLVLCLFVPLNLLSRYLAALTQGERDFFRYNVGRISVGIPYALALGVFMLAGFRSLGWVLTAMLFANGVNLATFAALTLPRAFREFGRPRLSLELVRRTARYGLRGHIGNLTPLDSLQFDLILVAALLNAHDLGLYAVATSAAAVVRLPASALGPIALAEVAAAPNAAVSSLQIGALVRLGVLLTLAGTTVLVFLSRPLLSIVYGGAFGSAAGVMSILTLALAIAALNQLLGEALRGAGEPAAATLAELASWPVGAATLVLLVPAFGLTGAACGVAAAYATAFAVNIRFALRNGLTFSRLLIPNRSDLAFLIGLARLLRHARPERVVECAGGGVGLGESRIDHWSE